MARKADKPTIRKGVRMRGNGTWQLIHNGRVFKGKLKASFNFGKSKRIAIFTVAKR